MTDTINIPPCLKCAGWKMQRMSTDVRFFGIMEPCRLCGGTGLNHRLYPRQEPAPQDFPSYGAYQI